MTNFWDAGNIAAWCALGLSILTPIATSISNNRFQLKMKRVELFVSSELKDIDEFISVVGNAIDSGQPGNRYSAAFGKVYAIASLQLKEQLDQLNDLILDHQFHEARPLFFLVCRELQSNSTKF